MRKFFYSISVFTFLCVLSAGYYGSYQLAEQRLGEKKSSPQTANQEAQGQLLEESPKPQAQTVSSVDAGEKIYCLKETDGYVMVYERDGVTLYEATTIVTSLLPESLRKEIQNGKYIKSQKELYRFLENYSS